MSDFNETYADAINSNSEERTSSMSDYSTSTTPDETRYQENTPTVTPEIVDDIDDADLVETNPVAALAGNFQDDELTAHPLAPGETNYTEQEARQATEDIKVKILHAAEAQYDLVHAVEKAFDGHIWVALGYPEGMKGWIQYCKDNFTSDQIRVTGQQRTDLITGFTPGKITNRGIAALLGVSHTTVNRVRGQAGIAPAEGRTRSADGKLRHVDTGSMSSEERRKKIVELSEEGAKQTDIADILDVSQSTVSDTLRKDRMRRMSEGLEPAKRFKKGHIRGSAYPWVGLVLFSSFSIAGNALHAMLNTGFHLPAWVPPVIMSIPPVALLYATHLIVIIAGDRLDKINTVLPVGLTVMEDTDVPAPVPAPSAMPAPAIPSEPPASAPEPAEPAKPEIPDLFDFQTIVPAMEDDAAPKADEAEAPAADASTPTVEQHAIPQPVMREPVIIPTLAIQPDERDAPTVDGQDEPAPEPVGPDVTAVEPADGPEEKTDDAQAEEKPKPGKTGRRGKAGADDEAWLAWIDELTAKGENPTASKAVDAGLAASGSTAKRYLARIRREHSERF